MRLLALAVAGGVAACSPAWSSHAQTQLESPVPLDCVHSTLLLQPGIDTTATFADQGWPSTRERIGYLVEGQPQPEPYQEVAFAGPAGGGHFIQRPDPSGAARIEVYWQWSGERPSESTVQAAEQWLRNYIVLLCRECIGMEIDSQRDIMITRSWADPDEVH